MVIVIAVALVAAGLAAAALLSTRARPGHLPVHTPAHGGLLALRARDRRAGATRGGQSGSHPRGPEPGLALLSPAIEESIARRLAELDRREKAAAERERALSAERLELTRMREELTAALERVGGLS